MINFMRRANGHDLFGWMNSSAFLCGVTIKTMATDVDTREECLIICVPFAMRVQYSQWEDQVDADIQDIGCVRCSRVALRSSVSGLMRILDVYKLSPNDCSSSAIDESEVQASGETNVRDCSTNDGRYSIGRRQVDHAKESVVTLGSFEFDSNVIDIRDLQLEKYDVQNISTDVGT
jgi:hypothetical protein